MTKRENYDRIKELIKNNKDSIGEDKVKEYSDFIDRQIELLARTKGKSGEKWKANEEIKEKILANMKPGRLYGMKEMLETFDFLKEYDEDFKLQRLNALITQLKNNEKIIRTVSKGKALFSLPSGKPENETDTE